MIEHAESTFGSDDPKTRFLREAASGIEELIWSRNAVEHEGGHSGTLEISNFELLPDGRLTEPEWRRVKDGAIVFGPSSLRSDFEVAIHNLSTLGENVFVSWAADNLSDPDVFNIASIPLEQRDPEMPVRWHVGVSNAFWERIGRSGE